MLPGISNLLTILALLTNQPVDVVVAAWQGKPSYGELKQQVAKAVEDFLTRLQAEKDKVNEAELENALSNDEAAMKLVADEKLLQVQEAVGLRPLNK